MKKFFFLLFLSFCLLSISNTYALDSCQYDDKSYDQNCLQELNYFSQFVKLASPRHETPIERSSVNQAQTADEQLLFLLRDELLPSIYASSKNTEETLKTLSAFFLECSETGKTESIQRVCNYVSSYLV